MVSPVGGRRSQLRDRREKNAAARKGTLMSNDWIKSRQADLLAQATEFSAKIYRRPDHLLPDLLRRHGFGDQVTAVSLREKVCASQSRVAGRPRGRRNMGSVWPKSIWVTTGRSVRPSSPATTSRIAWS